MIRALAAALAAAVVVAGLQTWRLTTEEAAHDRTRAQYAGRVAIMEREAREATEAARKEEQRRAQAQQEIIHETEQRLARARADAVAAADAGRRLRDRIAALASSCRPAASDPAAASPGPPADATDDLLADVQRRLGEATDRIAAHADAARAAGLACERVHDSLTSSHQPAALHE